MLTKIKIDRFKSARDLSLEFGRVNLLIGGNGAGKSNILEAIGVLAAALNRGVSDVELSRKGVRLTPPALMKSAFKNYDLPKTLRLEANFPQDVSYSLELTASDRNTNLSFFTEKAYCGARKILGRSGAGCNVLETRVKRTPDKHRSLWDQTRSAFEFPDNVQELFDSLSQYAIYAPQTEFLREIKSGSIMAPPIGLHGEGLSLAVGSLISQLNKARRARDANDKGASILQQIEDAFSLVWIPDWAKTVRVGAIDPLLKSPEMSSSEGNTVFFIDKYMHEKRNTLSAYDSSEGTLFLLFIAVLLGHQEAPPIFALDNVDSALNPALTRKLIEKVIAIIKRKQAHELDWGPDQIFMTSHNPTALDAFDLFDDDQRVFVVSRNDKGHTVATRLKPRKDMSREEWDRAFKGRKLSQLWIDGEISGALGVRAKSDM